MLVFLDPCPKSPSKNSTFSQLGAFATAAVGASFARASQLPKNCFRGNSLTLNEYIKIWVRKETRPPLEPLPHSTYLKCRRGPSKWEISSLNSHLEVKLGCGKLTVT